MVRLRALHLIISALYFCTPAFLSAAEYPIVAPPRFLERYVHSPNYISTYGHNGMNESQAANVKELEPGAFFILEKNHDATFVRANGKATTVHCDNGYDFHWKNDVTTLAESFWNPETEVAVRHFRLTFQWHSDSYVAVDFKNGTCTVLENFAADSPFSFQRKDNLVYFLSEFEKGHQQQLIQLNPSTGEKEILADCGKESSDEFCKASKVFIKDWPRVVGVEKENQVVLATREEVFLLNLSGATPSLKSVITVNGKDTRILWEKAALKDGLAFVAIIHDLAEEGRHRYEIKQITLATGNVETIFEETGYGLAIDPDFSSAISYDGLVKKTYEVVRRQDLKTQIKVDLPHMDSFWTSPRFIAKDFLSYEIPGEVTKNWIRFHPDGSQEIFQDWWKGSSDLLAISRDFTRVIAKGREFDRVVHVQAGPVKQEGALKTYLSFPEYKCVGWDCDWRDNFYYWPELDKILYYDDKAKTLKTQTFEIN